MPSHATNAPSPNHRPSLTWVDNERVICFGRDVLSHVPTLLRQQGFARYTLLTTERAARTLPSVVDGADAILYVPPGAVPEAAAAVRDGVSRRPVVALGGGRVVDAAKAIAAVDGLRCAAIPTTLSGAEMTRGHRMPAGVPEPPPVAGPFWPWCQRPSLVISAPQLTASQSLPDLAASAMNALAHAAEALWTSYANPVADCAALQAAGLIARGLNSAEPDRDALAFGGLLAGYAAGSAHIALHHALCQTVARMTHRSHAHINSVMLPHSVRFVCERAPHSVARLGKALGRESVPAEAVAALTARVGPTTLHELDVPAESLDSIADAAAGRLEMQNMDHPPDARGIRELLAHAY